MWQVQVMLFGTFWNFFLNIFHLQLVEFVDTEPMDRESKCMHKLIVLFLHFHKSEIISL